MSRILLLLATVSVVLFASTASAYNVYNETGGEIEVWGEGCMNCFHEKISNGKKGSCPGNKAGCRGDTEITFTRFQRDDVSNKRKCTQKVPAHGWVTISHPNGDTTIPSCQVFNEKGEELTKLNSWAYTESEYKAHASK